jgi:hypothetical protein
MTSRDLVPMADINTAWAVVGKLSIRRGLERQNATTSRVVENRTAMRILQTASAGLCRRAKHWQNGSIEKLQHPRGEIRRGFFMSVRRLP